MSSALRPPFGYSLLWVAGVVFALYLGSCAMLGWTVGGKFPGWYEGKFLVGPLWLGAGLGALVMAILMAVALWDVIRYRREGGVMRFRDWLPLGITSATGLAMAASFWFPWGIIVVYGVAELRWAS